MSSDRRVRRVLVTGAGGVGGVNFVRALRASPEKFFVVGTDYNEYYLLFPEVDVRVKSPRHDDPKFITLIKSLVSEYCIEFIHPQPEVEVEVLSQYVHELGARTLIPPSDTVKVCRDKYLTYLKLKKCGIPVPETYLVTNLDEVDRVVKDLGGRVWVRARKGAGGRLSLPCTSSTEVKLWIELWSRRGIPIEDFIVQEYLPGRDLAWDSLWYNGELIMSFVRERIHYIFPHISPSRVTGTPTVSKIVRYDKVNEICVRAVKALCDKPQGFFCIDLKEDSEGNPRITEVNIKAHTTVGLWSFVASRVLKLPPYYNMVYTYVKLGLGDEVPLSEIPKFDIYPEITLLRHIDCGVWIIKNGEKIRVL
ncbi:MAG: hypothetical protein DRJ40_06680 [Thermoprotei archaeon]|nr:MAG: hypothetical protein DRJ40_06680 [Thermoprotei archaeon]